VDTSWTASDRIRFWWRFPKSSTCRQSGLRAAITLLGDELESGRPGAGAVIPALVDAMLPLIVRAWLNTDPVCDEGDWRGAFTDPGIVGALERIHIEPKPSGLERYRHGDSSGGPKALSRRCSILTRAAK
jgi:hypothetical protein